MPALDPSLIPLLSLTEEDVRQAIARIVEEGGAPDAVAEYAASIDWSGATGEEPVARLLGAIEHLATEFAEGEISEARFWFGLGQAAFAVVAGSSGSSSQP